MAHRHGTVADHTALFAEIKSFLKTDAALSAAGFLWTEEWASADGKQVVLKGLGVDGEVPVYIGFRTFENPATQEYYLFYRGMTGVVPSALTYADHINVSPEVAVCLDPNPMEFWFAGNGRRFAFGLKISSVYETGYIGLFLPYATPVAYPLPYFLAGTRGGVSQNVKSWRSTDPEHTSMLYPSSGTAAPSSPSAFMMTPSGEWRKFRDGGDQHDAASCSILPMSGGQSGMFGEFMYPTNGDPAPYGSAIWKGFNNRLENTLDGGHALHPFTLVNPSPVGVNPPINETWGILDGVHWVPGFNNAAENTVTVGGVSHVVFQNIFRTTFSDYFTLAQD